MLISKLESTQQEFIARFEIWAREYFAAAESRFAVRSAVLCDSQKYSLFSGGKRFRPFLSYLVSQLFQKDAHVIRNFSLAIEMVHTYSLIHDDLPCMDNDDFRRGQPTNHKMFSEDIALLAGDGLLTDAFYLVASDTQSTDAQKIKALTILSEKIGSFGMVGGQALDMKADSEVNLKQLIDIHTLKTANLIESAVAGAAVLCGASTEQLTHLSRYGHHLGMAFQIKDDLLDHNDRDQDFKSYVYLLGIEKTSAELKKHSDLAVQALKAWLDESELLAELVDYNLKRER